MSSRTASAVMVPPLNFAPVVPGIYRSGYPNKRNHAFLARLQLRTILYLASEPVTPEYAALVHSHGIQFIHIPMQSSKLSLDVPAEVVRVILECEKPLLVHCTKGKHRVGVVMGLLRRLEHWSMASILDEYRRFAGEKARLADQAAIELAHLSIRVEFLPSWIIT